MNRWTRLWLAIARWWRNEEPDFSLLKDAKEYLEEYDDLYGRRTQILTPLYRDQAAGIIKREGHKRAPGLDNEIRVLAIAVERVVKYLELQNLENNP